MSWSSSIAASGPAPRSPRRRTRSSRSTAPSLSLAEGDPDGRMSWDQTAVLVAIKGYEPYYRVERGSIHLIDDEGSNRWIPDEKGRDFRLIEKVPAKEMATLIENYMMHQPISK